MMRQRFVLAAVVVAALVAACGGSSSETPPPLEPDPHGFHYAGAPLAQRDTSDAGTTPSASASDDDDDKPRTPAHATWGAGTGSKARP